MTTGLIIGKFMPPTMGHKFLIDFGVEYCGAIPCDDFGTPHPCLDVVVGYHSHEPISGSMRVEALREHYEGKANIISLPNNLPDYPTPETEQQFWNEWTAALQRATGKTRYDYVFASEHYGVRLAKQFGAQYIPVDVGRRTVMISATIVRSSIAENWEYVLPEFRKRYVRRVVISGPESCGKTTLCRDLAAYFKTEWVPEWARSFLEFEGNRYPIESDYPLIARAHAASEEALAAQATRVLISDTDAVCTKVAAQVLNQYYNVCVDQMARTRHYDLRIVMDTDVPYAADPLRYGITKRQFDTKMFTDAYDELGFPYIVIGGDWQTRFQTAVLAIRRMLASD